MKTITHPTPHKFALAISAIAAADHMIRSEVERQQDCSTVTFENGSIVRVIEGKLQESYDL